MITIITIFLIIYSSLLGIQYQPSRKEIRNSMITKPGRCIQSEIVLENEFGIFEGNDFSVKFSAFTTDNYENSSATISSNKKLNNLTVLLNGHDGTIESTLSKDGDYTLHLTVSFWNSRKFVEVIEKNLFLKLENNKIAFNTIDAYNNTLLLNSVDGCDNPNKAQDTSVSITSSIISGTSYYVDIYGTVTWRDALNNSHPADGFEIVIKEKNNKFSEEITHTDSNGNFSLHIYDATGTKKFNISVTSRPRSRYVDVLNTALLQNFKSSTGYIEVKSGKNLNVQFIATNTGNNGKAYSVAQALTYGGIYADYINNDALDCIDVHFPSSSITGYNRFLNGIYITLDDWIDWDPLIHEYGHYFADEIGMLSNIAVSHDLGENLTEVEGQTLESGLKAAWDEGYATFFSFSAQKFSNVYIMNIYDEFGEHTIGDLLYDDAMFQNGNLTTSIHQINPKTSFLYDDSELTVCNFLMCLSDSETNYYDFFSIGYDLINLAIYLDTPHTLSDFINSISNYEFINKQGLGALETKLSIAPIILISGSLDQNNFCVSYNIMNEVESSPNLISIQIYDGNYHLIRSIQDNTHSIEPKTLYSYYFTANDYSSVFSLDYFYVTIEARHSGGYSTGPYYSTFIRVGD